MQFFSTLLLISSASRATATSLSAGQLVSLKALRSVVESRQIHFCTPVPVPATCEKSCGSGYITCISFPTCYNPGAGDNCCSDGTYCLKNEYCTDGGCCPIGKTLAQCGAKVSLSVIPPATESTALSSTAALTSSSAYTSSTAVISYGSSSNAVTYTTPIPSVTASSNTSTATTPPPVQVTAGAQKMGSALELLVGAMAIVWMAL